MNYNILLPLDAASRLTAKAREAGIDLAEYVTRVLVSKALRPTLLEISGPIYEAFSASGISDDELGDLLETAKHQLRSELR